MVITFLHKFVRKYSRYYLSFWRSLSAVSCRIVFAWRFVVRWTLLFLKSRVNSRWFRSFFYLSVWIKTTLHWTFSFIFTTIVFPVSTGKFPCAWSWVGLLCSHTKSTLALEYSPVLKLSILSSMKFFGFFRWVRVRVADFSVGLWLGFG